MEDKNNQYGSLNRPNPNPPRRRAKAGEFKVNIDFDAQKPSVPSFQTKQNVSDVGDNKGFSVNLPTGVNKPGAYSERPKAPAQKATPRSEYVPQNGKKVAPQPVAPKKAAGPATKKDAKKTAVNNKEVEKQKAKIEKKKAKAEKKKAAAAPEKRITKEEYLYNVQMKKNSRLKSLIATIVCVIFIGIITSTLSSIAISTLNDILVMKNTSSETISVVVEEGNTFDDIFETLSSSGLLKQKMLVKYFCMYRKYDKVEYEPGVYYFETNEGVEAMLEEMMVQSTGAKNVINLTFPEGWTIAKIFAKIEKYEVCSAEKLYANLDIVAKQFDFYKNISNVNGRYLACEGYLFPDTYEFYIGESASSVLKKLFNNAEKHWTSDYAQKAKELGLSRDQVLTIASIIQREAGDKEQMYDISSVLHNRLNNSVNYPNLQCDSTKDYINAVNDLGLFTSDYDYKLYSESYNTYSAKGLPPGPICNPGTQAIEAALNPNSTTYYFFAHDSNGIIYLASTAEEHYANKNNILSGS